MSPKEAYIKVYSKLGVDQILYFIDCSEDAFSVACHGCHKAYPRSVFLDHVKGCYQQQDLNAREQLVDGDFRETSGEDKIKD